MSGLLVRILRLGEGGMFHERVLFFKEPVTTCSAREPGETWTGNEKDKGQNWENDRNDFP